MLANLKFHQMIFATLLFLILLYRQRCVFALLVGKQCLSKIEIQMVKVQRTTRKGTFLRFEEGDLITTEEEEVTLTMDVLIVE